MRVRNRISNRLLNSPLRAMRFGVARPCLLKSPATNRTAEVSKHRFNRFLGQSSRTQTRAYLARRYLTLKCVDAMFVRATVL